MPSKPTQDELVRLLDGAYDSSRMPTHAGAEFLAEAHARAVSIWLIRFAVVVGLAIAVGLGVVAYKLVREPPNRPSEPKELLDRGSDKGPGAAGVDRPLDALLWPRNIEIGLLAEGSRG